MLLKDTRVGCLTWLTQLGPTFQAELESWLHSWFHLFTDANSGRQQWLVPTTIQIALHLVVGSQLGLSCPGSCVYFNSDPVNRNAISLSLSQVFLFLFIYLIYLYRDRMYQELQRGKEEIPTIQICTTGWASWDQQPATQKFGLPTRVAAPKVAETPSSAFHGWVKEMTSETKPLNYRK